MGHVFSLSGRRYKVPPYPVSKLGRENSTGDWQTDLAVLRRTSATQDAWERAFLTLPFRIRLLFWLGWPVRISWIEKSRFHRWCARS